MFNKPWKLALAGVVILLILGGVMAGRRGAVPDYLAPLPTPNGYDAFVAAGAMVATNTADYQKLSVDPLRQLVESNAPALKRAREALSRDSRVPLKLSREEFFNGQWQSGLRTSKRLAQAFAAEGRLAELEGRDGDAVKASLDGIRMAQKANHGGLLIHGLVEIACESICLKPLPALVDRLDLERAQEAARALEELDASADSVDAWLKQEHDYTARIASFKEKLAGWINYKSMQNVRAGFARKEINLQRQRRQLILSLAARSFELEKGRRPASAAELVPAYLKAVPVDPDTGKPFSDVF